MVSCCCFTLWFRLKRWYIFTWVSCRVQLKIRSLQLSSLCCSADMIYFLLPEDLFPMPKSKLSPRLSYKENFTPKPGSTNTILLPLNYKGLRAKSSNLTLWLPAFPLHCPACLSVTWALCTFPCILTNYSILVCLSALLISLSVCSVSLSGSLYQH